MIGMNRLQLAKQNAKQSFERKREHRLRLMYIVYSV